MTKQEKFIDKFMRATDKVRVVLGPADRGDIDAPVVHRHDEVENESDAQLGHLEQHTDSQGHHYAEEKKPAHTD